MRYERGEILGLFCGELGIPATARVSLAPLYRGLRVWNLDSGLEFTIKNQGCARKHFPQYCDPGRISGRDLSLMNSHPNICWMIYTYAGNALTTTKKSVPSDCLHIFRQDDHALLARIADPNLAPWSEERETILSELGYRNLARREHQRYPVRVVFVALVSSLLHPLNPLRLFQRGSHFNSRPCS